ncbi:LysR family transcriptional regulator [Xylanibacillus composti]|uniref:Putative HTH-type transcriptional regulator YcgK n=1 Tax=Xylanibacillus composti TaxID=1572762 RepID=A0A8J4H136_9BACL|nr:LysR family transcriptional regulator [Xylanibacillus composti]MDT9725521.1 LysR family transcriptional regulator [Xylanibacillus composti]GIQ67615.1 putative HTH-type transcriptional regulator YcgK [Xylanibacillus composti]
MEFRQLRYAVQIAAEKNFSRAAESLHIAQPSLSQQLSKLEAEIGTLLFRRSTNSVELTHAGEIFIDRAQKILDMADQLKQEMEDISQMKKGKLVVGSLPITGSHVLPLVLPVFRQRFPEIDIVLTEDSSANLEVLTHQGKTDISLLSLPIQDSALQFVPLIEEEICLAVSPEHPLAAMPRESKASIASLKDEPFIVLKKGQGFRQIALDLCATAGFVPKVVFESSNIETVQSLVAAGMGIAFVPQMVARTKWNPFVPVYLTLEDRPTRTLGIAYRKGRYLSKASEAFIASMREVLQNEKIGVGYLDTSTPS